jgi:hypothetical protein
MYVCLGPFIGMFTVSAVGQLSDYWNNKFGQRVYFMLMFAAILTFSLVSIIIGHKLSLSADGATMGYVYFRIYFSLQARRCKIASCIYR